VPAQSFAHCFTTYVFQNNGLIASPSAFRNPLAERESLPATVLAVGLSTTTTATAEIMRCYRAARTRTRARTAKILEPILPDSLQRWLECNKSVPVPHPKVAVSLADLIFCLLQRDFISLKTTVISSNGACFRRKQEWSGLDGCFPLNTIPLLPSFRGSVDFCNFVHRVAAATALQPVKMLTAARATCPSLARKTVPPNCPKPVTTPVSRRPIAGKTDSRRRERKSRRRGRPREMRGYSASSSRRCL